MAYPTFSPDVERWRDEVVSELRAAGANVGLADKILWVISGESGGNPNAIGDGGVSIGLLQIQDNERFSGRPTKQQLLDPVFNIRYAIRSLGMGSGRFSDWGEGTNGTNSQFGALGNHPYPYDVPVIDGGNGDVSPPPSRVPSQPSGDIPVGFNIPGTGIKIPSPGDIVDAAGNVIGHLPGGDYVVDAAGNIKDAAGNIIGHLPGGSYIVDAAGNIKDAAGNIIGNVGDALHLDVFRQVGEGLAWLLNPTHWFRLFFLAAGIGLVIFGGYLYVRGDRVISDVQTAAQAAAMAGAA